MFLSYIWYKLIKLNGCVNNIYYKYENYKNSEINNLYKRSVLRRQSRDTNRKSWFSL